MSVADALTWVAVGAALQLALIANAPRDVRRWAFDENEKAAANATLASFVIIFASALAWTTLR